MSVTIATRLGRIERCLAQHRQEQYQRAQSVYVDPLTFATSKLGFEPDEWQTNVLLWQGKRLLLNCCRQSGKSTITALLALYTALYQPKALVLLITQS